MKFLDKLFFRIYKFQEFVGNKKPIAETIIGILALIIFNVISLIGFLGVLFDISYFFKNNSFHLIVILFGIILVLLIFYYLSNKKYDEILENNKVKEISDIRKGNIFVFLYILLSFLMICLSFYWLYLKNIRYNK